MKNTIKETKKFEVLLKKIKNKKVLIS